MKKISISFDTECENCMKAYAHYKSLLLGNKDAYASRIVETGAMVTPVILRPDYNAFGVLTHWHLDLDY